MVLKLGERGRVVIPAAARSQLGWEAGEELVWTVQPDRSVRLISAKDAVTQAMGMYAHLARDRSLVDELIAERRAEAARE